MKKMLKNINNISCSNCIFLTENYERNIHYEINENEEELITINVKLPRATRPEKTDEIVAQSESFVNGFKTVVTKNGEYAYVREEDGKLLPYRYDIAADFNELGYAMVGKDGNASWINKNFQYLSKDGELIDEDLEDPYRKFDGFQKVFNFNRGQYPLSRVHEGRSHFAKTYFFSPEGKIQEFYQFDGQISTFNSWSGSCDIDFNDRDYLITNEGIFFAKGYFCPTSYIFEYCEKNGTISEILKNADKALKIETGQKTLLKK